MSTQRAPVDLVGAFALPLPVAVVGELLGVQGLDRARLRDWSMSLLSTADVSAGERDRAVKELSAFFSDLVRERRARPADDLLSALVSVVDEEGCRLSENELVALSSDILLAGHETTAAALSNSVFVALRDGLWSSLCTGEHLPTAVGELLRYVPLGAGAFRCRVASSDVTVGDVLVKAGEAVFAATTSANRDPAMFDEPEALDLQRHVNPHMTFGYGAHRCLGANLATMQLEIGLSVLSRSFPHLRLATPKNEISWRSGSLVRGPTALPVKW